MTHDGQPVDEFEVRCGGVDGRRFVSADGTFELTRLASRALAVTVVADAGSARRKVELLAGETLEVELELAAWGSVRGRAVDLEGEPVGRQSRSR